MATSPTASFDPHCCILGAWAQSWEGECIWFLQLWACTLQQKALHLIHWEHIPMYMVETESHYVVQLNQDSLESLCSPGYPCIPWLFNTLCIGRKRA